VGGKTGSAEKAGVGGYNKTALVSSFAAAFPMDAPRYVVVTMIDNPRGSKATYGFRTAGMVIAPVVGLTTAIDVLPVKPVSAVSSACPTLRPVRLAGAGTAEFALCARLSSSAMTRFANKGPLMNLNLFAESS
jgi:hypothetical protein